MNGLRKRFSEVAETALACNPDESLTSDPHQAAGAKQMTGDLRRVLDDKSVDEKSELLQRQEEWE